MPHLTNPGPTKSTLISIISCFHVFFSKLILGYFSASLTNGVHLYDAKSDVAGIS